MTSKNSSWLKELRKRALWPTALTFLLFFLVQVVGFTLYLSDRRATLVSEFNTESSSIMRDMSQLMTEYTTRYFSAARFVLIALTTFAAVILALQGYAYLTNRRAIDFYESQPISRKRHFFSVAMISGFIFLAAYLSTLLIAVGLAAAFHGAGAVFFHTVLLVAIRLIALFYASFAIATLAVMLTGNILISIMAAGVLFLYEFLLRGVLLMMANSFFSTFYNGGRGFFAEGYGLWTSPQYYAVKWSGGLMGAGKSALANVLLGTVIFLLAYLAYRKRPNEAAGKAVVFRPVRVIVKVAIAMLGGVLAGYIFSDGMEHPLLSGFFCLILMTIIVCCVMEIIYAFDFKALFRHVPEMLLAIALGLLLFSSFYFDLIGYDKWVPRAEQVKDAAILTYSYYTNHYYEDGSPVNGPSSDYYERYMHLTNVEDVRYLAKLCNAYRDHTHVRSYADSFTILWRMKNGRKIYRTYALPVDMTESAMNAVLGTEEYRQGYYQVWHDDYLLDQENRVTLQYSNAITSTDACAIDFRDFETAYREDLEQVDYSFLLTQPVIGEVVVHCRNDSETLDNTLSFEVYESFKNTIDFLKASDSYLEPFTAEDLRSVTIWLRYWRIPENKPEEYNLSGPPEKTYTDPAQLKAIYDASYCTNPEGPFSNAFRHERAFSITASTTRGIDIALAIREGQLPAFLREDFAPYLDEDSSLLYDSDV